MGIMYISFYGGEPLLNFEFIKEIVEYVEQKMICKHRTFAFSMTTNAMLLNKYMDFLVKHKFHILISLDGDKSQNSYRVNHKGQSSFERIQHNINELREKYPDFFEKNVGFNSVLHNRNSVEGIYTFFRTKYDKLPNISELNGSGIRPDRIDEFRKTYTNSMESLHQSEHYDKIEKDLFMGVSSYKSLALYLHQYSGNYYRDYIDLLTKRMTYNHIPTGTCSPFSKKMFVTVNGKILPCERIGHQFALGQLTDDSITLDPKAISDKYNHYLNKMNNQCSKCKNKQSCIQCIFNLEDIEGKTICNGFMNEKMMELYKQKQLEFLRNHPEAYREIMDKITTI